MTAWIYEPPQNVSKEHFWLQHLAREYLWGNHYCRCIGTEVCLPIPEESLRQVPERLDVMAVGPRCYIAGKGVSRGPYPHTDEEKITIGIEVKTSRADFKSGFHADCCNFNYVLAPAGMIKKTEMPAGCGLLSADRDGWAIRIVRRAPEITDCVISIDIAVFAIASALTTEYAKRMRNTSRARVTWPKSEEAKGPPRLLE